MVFGQIRKQLGRMFRELKRQDRATVFEAGELIKPPPSWGCLTMTPGYIG